MHSPMYKYLFACCIVFVAIPRLNAQVQITKDDLPKIGGIYYHRDKADDISGLNAGDKGSNTIWDFSSLDGGIETFSKYVDPAQTPYGADFAESNIAEDNGKEVIYYSMTQDEGLLLGRRDTLTAKLSPSLLYAKFPIDLNSNYSGQGVAHVKAPLVMQIPTPIPNFFLTTDSVRVTVTITKKDTADALGIIKTPYSTYDAIRLVSYITTKQFIEGRITQTNSWQASPKQPADLNEKEYNWWAKGIGKEVFKIHYDAFSGTPPSSVNWYTGNEPTATLASLPAFSIHLAPNPGDGHMTLTVDKAIPSNFNITVYDFLGRLKYKGREQQGANKELNLSFLPQGMYFLYLETESGQSLVKKFEIKK